MGKTFVSRNELSYADLVRENDEMCTDVADMIVSRAKAVQALSQLHDAVYFCDPMLLATHQDTITSALRDVIAYLQKA